MKWRFIMKNNNIILVSKLRKNKLSHNPWKLIFSGDQLETLTNYNDEENVFEYSDGNEALHMALEIQKTGPISIILDPSLKEVGVLNHDDIIVSEEELIVG